ncbi:MAG: trimeric intracellular cation channel family protein [Magnetococcales bacterium]|nr:trimeric intracellular cation channel family protein [Magnetococcales bacterium]
MVSPLDIGVYWIGQIAVGVMSAAGVLEAGKKRFDLFGMIIIALATALGGGSLRDILLDRPVFWVHDQTYLLVAVFSAFITFALARWYSLSPGLFLIPDAVGLSLFTMTGVQAALVMGAPWLVASFMGVVTGVMGGVVRDILCNQEPLVFKGQLYATASWVGALVFIVLLEMGWNLGRATLVGGCLVLVLRLAAIHWDIYLPRFTTKQ